MRVRLQNVTKRFGPTVALEDVTLAVNDGELMALVGPSGCGKTTILRLIAGFEAPHAGDILFDDQSVVAVPPERRRVGLVFQNYALFPHMNVFKNVAYGLKFMKSCADPRGRVRELLELVGLAGLESRMPSELSAGQQQRVALARAVAPHPKMLLLDEPLSALDAKLRERLRLEIKNIQRTLKITTLYVTHDQEEALAVADRVAVMSVGRIEQIGSPREVYYTPATEFVARFIGRGNLLDAQVVRCDGDSAQLSLGTSSIRAHLAGGEVGQPVTVLVRPEDIRLNQPAENVLQGVIRGLEFAGDALWLHIYIETADSVLTVKANALASALREGDVVHLGFAPAAVYIVPRRFSAEPQAIGRRAPSTQ
jgi:thiamine transport system ATP-binding protein